MSSNNSNRFLASSFAAGLFLLVAAPAPASVARLVPFEEKVGRADSILLGRCTAASSEIDPSGRWITTRARFAVQKSFKGAPPGEVELVTPGGRVGSLHQQTVGIPSFSVGDERLIFVGDSASGPSVLYFDQGTYRVERDSNGTTYVEPVSSHLVLVDPQTGKAVPQGEPRRTLAEFDRDVKMALDRPSRRAIEAGAAPQQNAAGAQQPAGMVEQLREHAALIALAVVGMLIALIPLLRRS